MHSYCNYIEIHVYYTNVESNFLEFFLQQENNVKLDLKKQEN